MVAFARKATGRRGNWLMGWMLLATAVVFGAYALYPTGDAYPVSRTEPCIGTTAGGLAVVLYDFRKPRRRPLSSMPGAILRETAATTPPGTELRAYTLTTQTAMPLSVVGRTCKPLQPAGGSPTIDCAATDMRRQGEDTAVDAFCAGLGTMQRRVEDLARQAPELPVANAPLIEAIEEIRLVFAARSDTGPHSFHVFSDMIQHSAWYSHIATDAGDWSFTAFEESRDARAPVFTQASPAAPAVATEIFYLPRRGVTEPRAARDAHQRFWQQYFDSVGMPVVFRDQPTAPRFAASILEDSSDGLARVLRERELLRREQDENARTLAFIAGQRTKLEQARQQAASSAREFKQRENSLLEEHARERQAIEVERAEIARLQAEMAAWRADNDSG
ncbi:MAG: hypothetical protein F4029_07215 [Gammaproteobacteria bacterium]|nr:hypothetical protein [Gammaproteobacteria bacterium]MYF29477.1 hypothetical protein [Gammaproteobacteria bacterium]MYK46001.1 hypothetical protein [Gammaproteobacteria bacterium]